MKAVYFEKYGFPEVLELREIPIPQPDNGEIRIKVHATTVTAADCLMRKSESIASRIILGIKKPRKKYQTLGIEFAGEVDLPGSEVKGFKQGERVFGFLGFNPGAHAEYLCVAENASICRIPDKLDYKEAASLVDGATTALFFLLTKARLKKGQKVLIIGASGSIGSAAVQIAKDQGALVHGVCSNQNAPFILELGAEKAIDYRLEDYTKGTEKYSVIFDTVGKSSFSQCKKILSPKGKYIRTNGPIISNFIKSALYSFSPGKRFLFGMSVRKQAYMRILCELVQRDAIKPQIDRCYSLEDIADAHHYVESGHKRGNVAIEIIPLPYPK